MLAGLVSSAKAASELFGHPGGLLPVDIFVDVVLLLAGLWLVWGFACAVWLREFVQEDGSSLLFGREMLGILFQVPRRIPKSEIEEISIKEAKAWEGRVGVSGVPEMVLFLVFALLIALSILFERESVRKPRKELLIRSDAALVRTGLSLASDELEWLRKTLTKITLSS